MAKFSITRSTTTPIQPNRDIISSLPDDIVRHILSHLETKHAVRTSILSKRWRKAWSMCLSSFSLDDSLVRVDRLDCFGKFVESVLLHRRGPLKSLKVRFEKLPHEDVKQYICAAIRRNVEELDLSIKNGPFTLPLFKLPQILFSCKTIKILRLRSKINFMVNIDDSVPFPNLKVLHIVCLIIFDDLTIEKMLAKAPLLEELLMQTEMPVFYGETLRIQSSSLKRLVIRSKHTLTSCCGLLIKAPKLEYLRLNDFLSEEFEVERLSSLVKAAIDVGQCKISPRTDPVFYRSHVLGLLREIDNVKVLSLSASTLQILAEASEEDNFPTFPNLTQLKLAVVGNGWLILPKLLDSSPKLKAFTITRKVKDYLKSTSVTVPGDAIFKEESVAKCLLRSLEKFELKGFDGNKAEKEVLEYFIKNASFLKLLKLSFSATMSSDNKALTLRKLIFFPTTCQILIA
ncbi:putative F-box/FBD/LRR-repeat protein At5g22670 [Mercurialis annua]|uniref:putative F-box/FBD/LRR-repeat protein At5g22670 n=1 Tax=Mercurialis annua TaxID=3986 RepID=UPI0021604158|nr:putative F-box/FBD/LRR-repeat protein At5g22670 [Mercurialis annua]